MVNSRIILRGMAETDAPIVSAAFTAQGWRKPAAQFLRYWQESQAGQRDVLMAEVEGEFAGYVTIVWTAGYEPFQAAGIPEIVDFNVLIKFRRQGIGTRLMDEAERRISLRSSRAGLGVCLHVDYGPAQVLYARRGSVPDGRGVYVHGRHPGYGEQVTLDDDLTLFLVKELQ